MTVSGGPEHVEPTIPVRASVAFSWANAIQRGQLPAAVVIGDLLDDIEAQRPTPPPDIEWRAGLLVQRIDADGHPFGVVYLCRPPLGAMVRLETGEDHLVVVTQWRGGGYVLPGTEWRVVQGRPIVDFTDAV